MGFVSRGGVLELEKQGLFDIADCKKSKGRCESTGPFYLLLHLYEDFGIFENSSIYQNLVRATQMNFREDAIRKNVSDCIAYGKSVLTTGEQKFVAKFASDGSDYKELRPVWRDVGKDTERLGFYPVKVVTKDVDPKIFNKLARLALKVRQQNKIVELRP